MKSCFWLTGCMGPDRSIDFQTQCRGEVEIFLKDVSPELNLLKQTYSVTIPAYNDILMKRLYDECFEQFMKASLAIPKDRHYEWISSSLPLRKEIQKVKPTCETFTL
jgi:hypothetical protein